MYIFAKIKNDKCEIIYENGIKKKVETKKNIIYGCLVSIIISVFCLTIIF
jgi:hypothetical protein